MTGSASLAHTATTSQRSDPVGTLAYVSGCCRLSKPYHSRSFVVTSSSDGIWMSAPHSASLFSAS